MIREGFPFCGKRIMWDMRLNWHILLCQTSSRSNVSLPTSIFFMGIYSPPTDTGVEDLWVACEASHSPAAPGGPEYHFPPPTNGEIRVAVSKLTNGRKAGASHMQAEYLKEWLQGIKLEEDPEIEPNNIDTGDRWSAHAWLFQAIWEEGRIPIQL